MDIAMAELVIQIAQAQLDIVDFVLPCRGRKVIRQYAEQVFCRMAQLANLQGIPAKQFVSAANKPAGSLIETDPFQDLPIPVHVLNRKLIQNHHDVNIAVLVSFSAQVAALKANVKQPITESCLAARNQIIQITVQIKHRFDTPLMF